MNVRFTGRHIGLAEDDRTWAEGKLGALARFHRNLGELEIRVELDGGLFARVELETSLGHQHRAVVKVEAAGFRTALEQAVEALRRQLQKDKEKVVDRRRRAGARKGGARRAS